MWGATGRGKDAGAKPGSARRVPGGRAPMPGSGGGRSEGGEGAAGSPKLGKRRTEKEEAADRERGGQGHYCLFLLVFFLFHFSI